MLFFYYGLYIIVLPGLLFSIYAQIRVKTAYSKYSRVPSRNNWTGGDAARMLLERYNCPVSVQKIGGKLTDNYNPSTQVLSLSEGVYNSNSIAALGICAHETGHAIQHETNYIPLKMRSVLVPVTKIGSMLAFPLIIVGFVLDLFYTVNAESQLAIIFYNLGILAYSLSTIFALITLPVEFNASHRAKKILLETGVLDADEAKDAKKVLNAAALTYVAALLVSLLYLLRFVMIVASLRGNRRR